MSIHACAVFCCILLTCCCSVALGQMAMDCCLETMNQEIPKRLIVDYSEQVGGQGCAIDAMILVTRQRRSLCVPLFQPWVEDVVKHVKRLKKHCQKHNYKGGRCVGVKP